MDVVGVILCTQKGHAAGHGWVVGVLGRGAVEAASVAAPADEQAGPGHARALQAPRREGAVMDLGAKARNQKAGRLQQPGSFLVRCAGAIFVDPIDIVGNRAVFAGVGLDQAVSRPFSFMECLPRGRCDGTGFNPPLRWWRNCRKRPTRCPAPATSGDAGSVSLRQYTVPCPARWRVRIRC